MQMKLSFFRAFIVINLLLVANAANAQKMITEYFRMRDPFQIDLNDPQVDRDIYARGVLNVEWDNKARVLAVTYDPKRSNLEKITKAINKAAGFDAVTAFRVLDKSELPQTPVGKKSKSSSTSVTKQ